MTWNKILSREQSTMADTWTEYLCAKPANDGFVIGICIYEIVDYIPRDWFDDDGEPLPEFRDANGDLALPAEFNAGLPGGRETGHAMSDYIIPSGPFLRCCRQLMAEGFELPWLDRHLPQRPERVQQYQAALADAGVQMEFSASPLEGLPQEVDGKPVVFTGRVRQGGVISAVAVGHRQAALAVMCRG